MTEQEKVRVEEVREEIYKIFDTYDPNSPVSQGRIIGEILSVKDKDGKPMLGILSDDQSLPKRTWYKDWGGESGKNSYKLAQKDMRDFRRVITGEG